MRIKSRWIYFAMLCLGVGLSRPSEAAPATKDDSLPQLSLRNQGWSSAGELVFGIEVTPKGKALKLGGISGDEKHESLVTFSMAVSELEDVYTGKVIRPLPRLPRKPFFGSMEGIIMLQPGDSLVFGVAFPRPPDPPLDNKGNQQDFKLRLSVPNMKSVDIVVPFVPKS